MITQQRAQDLLKYGETPWLTTDEVATVADLKPVTLRQWINRGYLGLRMSPRAGTGRKMLYSFPALIEVCAFSFLTQLHFPPSEKSLKDISDVAVNYAVRHLGELAGVWGQKYSDEPLEAERYLVVWRELDRMRYRPAAFPVPPDCASGGAWIVLDVHRLAQDAVTGLEQIKG